MKWEIPTFIQSSRFFRKGGSLIKSARDILVRRLFDLWRRSAGKLQRMPFVSCVGDSGSQIRNVTISLLVSNRLCSPPSTITALHSRHFLYIVHTHSTYLTTMQQGTKALAKIVQRRIRCRGHSKLSYFSWLAN